MHVLDIVRGTTVDGPGFRTSIYFSGCKHQCHGCHNPQSWDFNSGKLMSIAEILDVIIEEDFDVTYSGGDPLYHPEILSILSDSIRKLGHTIWLYTGFRWEEIMEDEILREVVEKVDVIVDGPYKEEEKDRDLLFRGSGNQRIIDVNKSLGSGHIELWNR